MTNAERHAVEIGGWKPLEEMAAYLGISTRCVYAMVRRGELEKAPGLSRSYFRVNVHYKGTTIGKRVASRHRKIQAVFNLKEAQLELGLVSP